MDTRWAASLDDALYVEQCTPEPYSPVGPDLQASLDGGVDYLHDVRQACT